MSALPNFKASSFFRAARGCGALALAGAIVLPMTPALAQTATADAPAAAVAGSLPDDRVRENPVAFLTSVHPFDRVKLSPKLTGIFDHFSLGWRRFDEDFSLPF